MRAEYDLDLRPVLARLELISNELKTPGVKIRYQASYESGELSSCSQSIELGDSTLDLYFFTNGLFEYHFLESDASECIIRVEDCNSVQEIMIEFDACLKKCLNLEFRSD